MYEFSLLKNTTILGIDMILKVAMNACPSVTGPDFSRHESMRSFFLNMRHRFLGFSDPNMSQTSHLLRRSQNSRSDCQSFRMEIFDRKHMLVTLYGRSPP